MVCLQPQGIQGYRSQLKSTITIVPTHAYSSNQSCDPGKETIVAKQVAVAGGGAAGEARVVGVERTRRPKRRRRRNQPIFFYLVTEPA